MSRELDGHLEQAMSAARDAVSSHDPQKIATAHLQIQMAQLAFEMDRKRTMPPSQPGPSARGLIGQALAIVAGVAAVVALAASLMDSRISDLGARVATVEARLVSIDGGLSDIRAETAAIAGELRAMNRQAAPAAESGS